MSVIDSFRTLKMNILSSDQKGPIQTLLVTSADLGEGKSTIISNLGIVMAQSGNKVIVIDADLRKPKMMKLFNLPNDVGLTNILTHKAVLSEAVQSTTFHQMKVLSSGPLPSNPVELLESVEMSELIADLRREYDFILVDSPAILAVTDALLLVPRMDAVSLVVRSSYSTNEAVRNALKKLERVGARINGVIINREQKLYRNYYSY